MYLCIFHMKSENNPSAQPVSEALPQEAYLCTFRAGTSLLSHQRGIVRRFHATMYGFIRMLAKAAVWAALVRLFNWLMDEFLS